MLRMIGTGIDTGTYLLEGNGDIFVEFGLEHRDALWLGRKLRGSSCPETGEYNAEKQHLAPPDAATFES